MKQLLIFLVASLFICISCEKDPIVNEEFNIPNFPIHGKVMGVVEDQFGNPISEAIVTISYKHIATLDNGYFFFDRQMVNSKGTLVKATKEGYYDSYKMINPVEGISSVVVFKLVRRVQVASIASSAGGAVNLNGGATVTLDPNSIVDANGQPYSGSVSVFAHYLDPSDLLNSASYLSGDMRCVDLENKLCQVLPIGVIEVELESAAGTPLNIASGSFATLSFPTQSAPSTEYPQEIALFIFNKNTGFLEQVGKGIHNGNGSAYIATVDHFSQWLVGNQAPKVELELTILTSAGTPFRGNASLSSNTGFCTMPDPLTTQCIYWTCIPAVTNSNGQIFGGVPEDMEFQLTIWDNDNCGNSNIIHSLPIGPFSSDAVETIIVNPSDYSQSYKEVQITGNFINCNAQPVENGLMKVDGRFYALGFDGSFNLSFLVCDSKANIEIEAFDFDSGKSFGKLTKLIPDPVINNLSLDDLTICLTLDEYITVNSANIDLTFIAVEILVEGGMSCPSTGYSALTLTGLMNNNENIKIGICDPNFTGIEFFPIIVIGLHDIIDGGALNIGADSYVFTNSEANIDFLPINFGEYVQGTYSGTLQNSVNSSDQMPINGSFRIKYD